MVRWNSILNSDYVMDLTLSSLKRFAGQAVVCQILFKVSQKSPKYIMNSQKERAKISEKGNSRNLGDYLHGWTITLSQAKFKLLFGRFEPSNFWFAAWLSVLDFPIRQHENYYGKIDTLATKTSSNYTTVKR